MKKKMLSVLLVSVLSLSLSAGLGVSAEEASAESAKAIGVPTEEEITLRFSWWGGDARNEATLAVIEAFQELYPNVTIEAEYSGGDGYNDKLSTQLAAGTAADIVQIDPAVLPAFVQSGAEFYTYNEFGFDMSEFDESYIGIRMNGRFGEVQLGLPTGLAGSSMVYNTELAEAIGIDFSQEYDWEDIIEWGKMVREYDPEMYLLCSCDDYVTNMIIYPYLKQITGETIFDEETKTMNLTEDQLLQVFQYVDRLYKEEVIAPASYSTVYASDNLQTDPNWIAGKYVSVFTYTSMIEIMESAAPEFKFDIGLCPIPENAIDIGYNCTTPQLMIVPTSCEHPEVAFAFLDYFFNSDEAAAILGTVRSVPASANARAVCESEGILNPLVKKGADICINYASPLITDGYASSVEGKQIFFDAVEAIGYGYTPEEVTAETMELLQGLLEQ